MQQSAFSASGLTGDADQITTFNIEVHSGKNGYQLIAVMVTFNYVSSA
jgi:hypothetical protein